MSIIRANAKKNIQARPGHRRGVGVATAFFSVKYMHVLPVLSMIGAPIIIRTFFKNMPCKYVY